MTSVANSALITQNRLTEYAGSEVVTLELAEHLSQIYDKVYIATYYYDYPIKKDFESLKNVIVCTPEDKTLKAAIESQAIDLAWIHHQIIPMTLLDNYTDTKVFFFHMSSVHHREFPIFPELEIKMANTILTNSTGTAKALQKLGFFESKHLTKFGNPAPKYFLQNRLTESSPEVKKICVISNHVPSDVKAASRILESQGVIVDILGLGQSRSTERVTPEFLSGYDAVICIGKTVQYALLMGVPVYCYDHFGGPGYITRDNIDLAQHMHFSGKGFSKKKPENIAAEIIDGFSNALSFYETFFDDEKESMILETSIKNLISKPIAEKQKLTEKDRNTYMAYIRSRNEDNNLIDTLQKELKIVKLANNTQKIKSKSGISRVFRRNDVR